MPAAQMKEIVGPAAAAGRGVGAFNVIGIEHAAAIVAGAEAPGGKNSDFGAHNFCLSRDRRS